MQLYFTTTTPYRRFVQLFQMKSIKQSMNELKMEGKVPCQRVSLKRKKKKNWIKAKQPVLFFGIN